MAGMFSPAQGIVCVGSTFPFAKTISCLHTALERRGMTIHARISHAANARAANLTLGPMEVFIFGYPEAEGPVLALCPQMGVDLPRRISVHEDQAGKVWISFNDPVWLGHRYGVSDDVLTLLGAMSASLTGIVLESGGISAGAD